MRKQIAEILAHPDNGWRVKCANPARVAELIRMLAESMVLPPIVLGHGGELLDGKHRIAAALARGESEIEYEITRDPAPGTARG